MIQPEQEEQEEHGIVLVWNSTASAKERLVIPKPVQTKLQQRRAPFLAGSNHTSYLSNGDLIPVEEVCDTHAQLSHTRSLNTTHSSSRIRRDISRMHLFPNATLASR